MSQSHQSFPSLSPQPISLVAPKSKPKKTHKPKRLSLRQKTFCLHFFESQNQTQSAIAAGCAPNSASTRANRWLKIPAVQSFLAELAEKAGLTPDSIMDWLTKIVEDPKTKNSDRVRCLELAGKRHGMWIDRQEIDVTNLAERIAEGRKRLDDKDISAQGFQANVDSEGDARGQIPLALPSQHRGPDDPAVDDQGS